MAITVQESVVVLTSDDQNHTLGTAVDMSRSCVIVDASTASELAATGFQDWGVTGVLTDASTVQLQREGFTVDAEVVVQVVTCDQGEFLVVDRGQLVITTGNVTQTGTVVETDPGRTLLMYNSRGNFDTTDTYAGFVTCKFNSGVQIEAERGVSSTTRTFIRYEVVEWSLESGVRVAAGVADATALLGSVASTVAHSATVTTANTWMFSQSRHESNGLEQCALRARFDATNIIMKRYDTTDATFDSHVAWQLVTFLEDICQQKTPAMSSVDTSKDTTVTTVDTGATIVWSTNSCDGTGTSFGRNAWNTQVLNSTTLRSKRSFNGQACEMAISICDFSGLSDSQNILFLGHT